jgi:nicotinate (nicotinamide) nucleotide adenylyltransferase
MKRIAIFDLRVRMLHASLAHLGSQVIVDPVEATLPTPNYTIRTVEALMEQEENLDITWLCGADVYADRHRWKDWERLKELMTFEVFGREGVDTPDDTVFRAILPNISSTSVRSHVASGLPVQHLVHSDAMAIIEAEGLYRT